MFFPFIRIFHLTFRAIFSDETGLTCAMKLDDLPVHFSDLFNPLQVPAYFKVDNACISFCLASAFYHIFF